MDFKENLVVKDVSTIPQHINEFFTNNQDHLVKIYNDERANLENEYGILFIKINVDENKVDISYITSNTNKVGNIVEENMWNTFKTEKKQIIFVNDSTYGKFLIDLNKTID